MLQERVFWICPLWTRKVRVLPIKWLIYFLLLGKIMLRAFKGSWQIIPSHQEMVSGTSVCYDKMPDFYIKHNAAKRQGGAEQSCFNIPQFQVNCGIESYPLRRDGHWVSQICLIDPKSMDTKFMKLHKRTKWKRQYIWEVGTLIS